MCIDSGGIYQMIFVADDICLSPLQDLSIPVSQQAIEQCLVLLHKAPGLAAGLFVCLGRVLLNQGARISPAESHAMVDGIPRHFSENGSGLWAIEVRG